ncbi:MAG: radical SAM protein [Candidatus Schekmanbacteria bacterium]|nr:radical SAM protein [Candidatus Schekmanbacteria bacterium]
MLLKAPLEVFWCVTNRCNLHCRFCSADSGSESVQREADIMERGFILDQIIQNRVLKVYLTGGEPLLCPQTIDYIKVLSGHKIFVELTTNGTLLDEKTVRDLKAYGINRVQVSINGSSPEINDGLMGASFDLILTGLNKLIEHKINTHVKVTITRHNLTDIPNLIRLLLNMGLNQMELFEVIPLGRGFLHYSELRPDESELMALREHIAGLGSGHKIRFRSFSLAMKENDQASACSIGHQRSRTCLIMADGNVIPCAPAQVWNFNNNVLEKGLSRCWHALEDYRQCLAPKRLGGKCGNCDLQESCGGGCRALAYQFTNDLWAEYTLCPHIKGLRIYNYTVFQE